jgi:cbb3-type cytochrome oxidase cytochrome c subunit
MFKKGKLSDLAQEYVNSLKEGLNEAKKRPGVAAEIKEIEKSNEALALEAKIAKIKEAIAKRESKLQLAETEELAEMIDSKMVKTLQKEIKELEKYKAKAEGLYEKLTKTKSKEVIDEAEPNTEY